MILRLIFTIIGIFLILGGFLMAMGTFVHPVSDADPEYLGMGMILIGVLIIGFSWTCRMRFSS